MDIYILQAHITFVSTFLLLFLFKTVVLFTRRRKLLNTVRANTKVLEAVLGVLILATGGYMMFKGGYNQSNWLTVKFILVLVLIPAGIYALRTENRGTAFVTLLGFFYIYGVSETKSLNLQKQEITAKELRGMPGMERAEAIYGTHCLRCHGIDGTEQNLGATNLVLSKLPEINAREVIAEGRNTMPAFGNLLTDDDLRITAAYIQTFKDKDGLQE